MLDKALAMLSILLGYFSLVQLNNPTHKIKIINTQYYNPCFKFFSLNRFMLKLSGLSTTGAMITSCNPHKRSH
jgi:hypothetical protein